jgi:hypothetical protein
LAKNSITVLFGKSFKRTNLHNNPKQLFSWGLFKEVQSQSIHDFWTRIKTKMFFNSKVGSCLGVSFLVARDFAASDLEPSILQPSILPPCATFCRVVFAAFWS